MKFIFQRGKIIFLFLDEFERYPSIQPQNNEITKKKKKKKKNEQ